jgi:hypothetical protein
MAAFGETAPVGRDRRERHGLSDIASRDFGVEAGRGPSGQLLFRAGCKRWPLWCSPWGYGALTYSSKDYRFLETESGDERLPNQGILSLRP